MGLLTRKSADAPEDDSEHPDQEAGAKGLSAGKVRDLYEAAYKSIRYEAHNYWLNLAFLMGHQWLFFNDESRRLDTIPRDPDRVQVTVNKVLPASRTVIAKATSRELRFDVPPTMADDATIRGAKIAEAVLVDVHREHDWETKRESALWAMWRGGTSAIAVDWDASAGQFIEEHPVTGKAVGTGDSVETVLSIVEFAVEPGVADGERARWWVKAQALPPEQVQANHNLSKRPKPDATAGMSPLQQRLLAETGTGKSDQTDLTLVLTYYERPNPLRPNGLIQTVVGDDVVDGPHAWYFPWKHRLNLAIMRETYVDNRWTGETVLSAARPVQVAINQSWSSIIEHMKLAGNARLAIPQSAAEIIESLTDEPGETLEYPDGSDKPSWITPPVMPAWWIEQPEKLKAELDDILGVHAVSRGQAPTNIESGYGLSVLAENDATPLGRVVKETATAMGKVATMVLKLYEHKVKESRTAKVLMPGQAPETAKWDGKDLLHQTTAEVPLDAVLPRSRAAMQAFAEKAMSMGLITNVAQFARIAEFPMQDDLIEAVAPDVGKARRENHAMALGEMAEVHYFDDHAIHLHELNDFRKSARYALLPPETQAIFEAHAKGHEEAGAVETGRQVAKGQVNVGLAASPDAGGAPTPDLTGGGGAPPAGATPQLDMGTPAATPSPDAGPPTDPMPPGS